MNRLGRALTEYDDPPVKMLIVYNCNPLATMPSQNRVLAGLRRDDLFTVVFDQVMTDTARWADVVLPATTFLEQYDLALSYGHGAVQLVQPVIEPAGESRPQRGGLRRARGSARHRDRRAAAGRRRHLDARGRRLAGQRRRRAPEPRHHPRQRARCAGAVRRRLSPNAGRPGRPAAGCPRTIGSTRSVPLPPGAGSGRLPPGADLSRQRQDRLFHARGVADAAGPAPDSPARRRVTGPVDRRRGARLQRRGRDPLRHHRQPGREARRRQPPQGPLAARHDERMHRQRPRVRRADRPGRRRLLQRRPRGGDARRDRRAREDSKIAIWTGPSRRRKQVH